MVAKAASDPSPLVGETVTFGVAVANRGPAAAAGVAVADALPPGLAFVSSTASLGTYDPATGIWWVGGLADGASATLVVVARATAPVAATNTAIVAGADADPNLANNVASAAVTIRTPAPPAVISLARYGFHTQPTSLVLGFNTPLVAAAAQDVANYQIVQIGPGGYISAPIPIASAIYDAATDTVTLNPSRQLYLFGHYVLTVNGMAPNGLISTTGIRLGGTTVGGPGANFVRVFGPEILAGPNPAVQPRRPSPPRPNGRPPRRSTPRWRPPDRGGGERPVADPPRPGSRVGRPAQHAQAPSPAKTPNPAHLPTPAESSGSIFNLDRPSGVRPNRSRSRTISRRASSITRYHSDRLSPRSVSTTHPPPWSRGRAIIRATCRCPLKVRGCRAFSDHRSHAWTTCSTVSPADGLLPDPIALLI